MKKVKFGDVELELYDSIHNLPPHRESQLNYFLLSDSGIGATFKDFDSHISNIQFAAYQENKDDLALAIENLKLNFISMLSKYNPKHLAWVCMVHSINGELITDISEDNLSKIATELSEKAGAEYRWEEIFDELKKKLPESWFLTFQNGEEMEES